MKRILPILVTTALATTAWGATPAGAAVAHTVAPGETLWSIAQADGLTPAALAAANGLAPDAQLIANTTIQIPAGGDGGGGSAGGAASNAGSVGTASPPGEPAGSAASASQPATASSYLVQSGDTLSALAASAGVSTSQLATANGLSVDGILPAGSTLQLPGGQGSGMAAAPAATPVFVTAGQIGGIAADNGVPASLAEAVAWQESGFNNGLVSSADARGVMQIIPSTWNFVQTNLASAPLDPTSALDNVKAGVLYLRYLLDATGGDAATAVAGYYQGLLSIRSDGILPETEQYVDSVLALRPSFGGP